MAIAVYGANGYEGKLVVSALLGRGQEVVLVGRRAEALCDAAREVGAHDADQRLAASDDHQSLVAAFTNVDVVVNCAGPFTPTGALVVRAAIAAGCHYLDTAGEQAYVKALHDELDSAARTAGVIVSPAFTDGGAPGDWLAHELAARLGPLKSAVVAHLIEGGGGASRGTLRSVLAIIGALDPDGLAAGGLAYDHGAWRPAAGIAPDTFAFPDRPAPTPVMPFPLAEVITVPRHVQVERVVGVLDADLANRLAGPLTPEIIDQLPEGPTPQARQPQRFTVVIDATAIDGRPARGIARGTDTYGTTANLAAEAATRIATRTDGPAGVLTQTEALSPNGLRDALKTCGVTCELESH